MERVKPKLIPAILSPIPEEGAVHSPKLLAVAKSIVENETAKNDDIKEVERLIEEEEKQQSALRKSKGEILLQTELKKKRIQEEQLSFDNFYKLYSTVIKAREVIVKYGKLADGDMEQFKKMREMIAGKYMDLSSAQTAFMGTAIRANRISADINSKLDKTEKTVKADWEKKMADTTIELEKLFEEKNKMQQLVRELTEENKRDNQQLLTVTNSNDALNREIIGIKAANIKRTEMLERARFLNEQKIKEAVEEEDKRLVREMEDLVYQIKEITLKQEEVIQKSKSVSVEIEKTKTDNETSLKAVEELKKKIAEQLETNSALQKRNKETEIRVNNIIQEKESCSKELNEINLIISEKSNDLLSAKERVTNTSESLSIAKVEEQRKIQTLSESKETLAELQQNIDRCKEVLKELDVQKTNLDDETVKLEKKKIEAEKAWETNVAENRKRLTEAQNAELKLKEAILKVSEDLKDAREKHDSNKDKLIQLGAELEQLLESSQKFEQTEQQHLNTYAVEKNFLNEELKIILLQKLSLESKVKEASEDHATKQDELKETLMKKENDLNCLKKEMSVAKELFVEQELRLQDVNNELKATEALLKDADENNKAVLKDRENYEAALMEQKARQSTNLELSAKYQAAEAAKLQLEMETLEEMYKLRESYNELIEEKQHHLEALKETAADRNRDYNEIRESMNEEQIALDEARETLASLKTQYEKQVAQLEAERIQLKQLTDKKNAKQLLNEKEKMRKKETKTKKSAKTKAETAWQKMKAEEAKKLSQEKKDFLMPKKPENPLQNFGKPKTAKNFEKGEATQLLEEQTTIKVEADNEALPAKPTPVLKRKFFAATRADAEPKSYLKGVQNPLQNKSIFDFASDDSSVELIEEVKRKKMFSAIPKTERPRFASFRAAKK